MSKPATTVDLAAFKKQLADSLERSAKSAGQTIVKESLTCEIATGLQVVTAAIQRDDLPTEKEITAGVDMCSRMFRSTVNPHYRVAFIASVSRFRDTRRRVMSKSRLSTQKGRAFTR